MNFAPFTPYEPSPPETYTPTIATRATPVRAGSIEALVAQLGPTAKKLRSEFLNTSVYYYIPQTNTIMEIETTQKLLCKAAGNVDGQLRALNQLPRA
jgi:hypothetical protein